MTGAGRVLVVEDEVLIRMLAVDMLLDLGREADEAGSAGEALAMLRAPGAAYAVVLLDLGLPDKHGDDLVREIRQTHADLPLVVASGEDQVEVKARLEKFAPIRFLGKPYDLDGLKKQSKAQSDRLTARSGELQTFVSAATTTIVAVNSAAATDTVSRLIASWSNSERDSGSMDIPLRCIVHTMNCDSPGPGESFICAGACLTRRRRLDVSGGRSPQA